MRSWLSATSSYLRKFIGRWFLSANSCDWSRVYWTAVTWNAPFAREFHWPLQL